MGAPLSADEIATESTSTPRARLKIFIASPTEVDRERGVVIAEAQRLRADYGRFLDIEVVDWRGEVFHAFEHPQDQIEDPADADLVVVILWTTLGSPLSGPRKEFVGALTGRTDLTGTQWELEQARGRFDEAGTPRVEIYQKSQYQFCKDDRVEMEARLDRIDEFLRTVVTVMEFETEHDFEILIARSLTDAVKERMRDAFPEREIDWHANPYRGLERFGPEHAAIFAGRSAQRIRLRKLVEDRWRDGRPWVLVTGPSGSGKSSLVGAGLLRDIAIPGLIPGVALGRHAIVRPGGGQAVRALAEALLHPEPDVPNAGLPELADARYDVDTLVTSLESGGNAAEVAVATGLNQLRSDRRLDDDQRALLVIVVDQLEELVRLTDPDVDADDPFVQALTGLATHPDVVVVATMRADLLDLLDRLPALKDRFDADGQFFLGAPTDDELKEIIVHRSLAAGVEFDDATLDPEDEVIGVAENLCDLILYQAQQLRSLPLIEHLLDQLWRSATDAGDHRLSYERYRELKGAAGAIGVTGDVVLRNHKVLASDGSFRDEDEFARDVRATLVGLAAPADVSRDEERWVKRSVDVADVPERVQPVIDDLLASRLLTPRRTSGGDTIEFAHDRLLESWETLRGWLVAQRHDVRLAWRLERAIEGGAGTVLGDELLDEAIRLHRTGSVRLGRDIADFIETQAKLRADRIRKRKRRRRAATIMGVVVAAVVGAAVSYAITQRNNADRETQRRTAIELASTADQLANQSLDRALLLAVEARSRARLPETEGALIGAMSRLPQLERILRSHTDEVRAVAVSPDGSIIATADRDGLIVVWSSDGEPLHVITGHTDEIHGLAFDPAGQVLVSASDDGTIRRWSIIDWSEVGAPSTGHEGDIRRVVVGPAVEGRPAWVASAGHDGTVRIWDLATGALRSTLSGHDMEVVDVDVNADGTWLASVGLDGRLLVFDTDGFELALAVSDVDDPAATSGSAVGLRAVAFHPSEPRTVVVGGQDGRVVELELSGAMSSSVLHTHVDRVFDVVYASDGSWVASGGRDQTVRVSGPQVSITLDGHAADVRALAALPDGRLVSGSRDQTVMLWSPTGDSPILRRLDDETTERVLTASDGSTHSLVWRGTITLLRRVEGDGTAADEVELPSLATAAALVGDAAEVAVGGVDGVVRFFDAGSLQVVAEDAAHDANVVAVASSPDGRSLVSADEEGGVVRWDISAHTAASTTMLAGAASYTTVRDAAIADDGTVYLTNADGSVLVWSGGPVAEFADNLIRARRVIVADDGSLVVGTDQEQLQVWDLEGDVPRVRLALDHEGEVGAMAVSSDERLAAVAPGGETVTLWDFETGRDRGRVQSVGVNDIALESSALVIATTTGVERWELDPDVLVAEACRIVGRDLTEAEWSAYLDEPYRRSCT